MDKRFGLIGTCWQKKVIIYQLQIADITIMILLKFFHLSYSLFCQISFLPLKAKMTIETNDIPKEMIHITFPKNRKKIKVAVKLNITKAYDTFT